MMMLLATWLSLSLGDECTRLHEKTCYRQNPKPGQTVCITQEYKHTRSELSAWQETVLA